MLGLCLVGMSAMRRGAKACGGVQDAIDHGYSRVLENFLDTNLLTP